MTDDHYFFKKLAERFGTDDPKMLDDIAAGVFATYAPFDRNDVINKTEEALGNDDVSLRQRAQLLDFYRKLKTANNRLRRAGR